MTQSTLANLLIYRNLLNDPIIAAQVDAPGELSPALSAELIAAAERFGIGGNLFCNYFIYQLLQDSNLVTNALEQSTAPILAPGLAAAFQHDMTLIADFLLKAGTPQTKYDFLTDYTPSNPTLPESFLQLSHAAAEALEADDPVAALSCRLLAF